VYQLYSGKYAHSTSRGGGGREISLLFSEEKIRNRTGYTYKGKKCEKRRGKKKEQ
jgi:hypothetical protein